MPRRKKPPENIAAVDLGSNSFHMVVARLKEGELSIIDRLRETVRLAEGLGEDGDLQSDARARALACLSRFGQRIRAWPRGSVRAVGTNALRVASDAKSFLAEAEEALGHSIEVISGIEEARLVYQGVTRSLADDGRRRLVIDIGGSSTELIIGEAATPMQMESLRMGCVTATQRHFPQGLLSKKYFREAELHALVALEPVTFSYRNAGWASVVGSSGTIRAASAVIRAAGWSDDGITREAIEKLIGRITEFGTIESLRLTGLNDDRAPSFPGGVAVLSSVFKALGIERMQVADGALREGLLFDLIGRFEHDDIRSASVAALAKRYHIDMEQARRVNETAQSMLNQVAEAWGLDAEYGAQFLAWGAELHEIGIDIAHSGYHKHGAYIVENSDLLGFSTDEQRLLALLIRGHRRKFPVEQLKECPDYARGALVKVLLLLRLAVLLHRSRSRDPLPAFEVGATKKGLSLTFPAGWLEQHPLTQADLAEELRLLKPTDYTLEAQ